MHLLPGILVDSLQTSDLKPPPKTNKNMLIELKDNVKPKSAWGMNNFGLCVYVDFLFIYSYLGLRKFPTNSYWCSQWVS